jgi:hypothetical protein
MGQFGLARAELEALAGSGDLDDDGLLSLAEARWRTGDLAGAGEAARAYVASGGGEALGFVIAAESIADVGRPGEASRLAASALEATDVPLDRLFAGMPRSSIWPADTGDARDGDDGRDGHRDVGAPPAPGAGGSADGRLAAGLAGEGRGDPPDGLDELEAGRAAIAAGRRAEAALRLGLVLRTVPHLAPAVLEATSVVAGRWPELELVRGDAYRLVGHELDAHRAYRGAAAALPARPAVGPAREAPPSSTPRPDELGDRPETLPPG